MEKEYTPESAFDEPKEPSKDTKDYSIDDIILGTGDEEEAIESILEKTDRTKKNDDGKEKDNDEIRYQYWQSQSDKRENENKELRGQLTKLQEKFADVTVKLSQPPVVEKPDKGTGYDEEFPPPPEKPTPPTGFSEADVQENPSGASAQYIGQVQDYYDKMLQYTSLKSEYAYRKMEELSKDISKRDKQRTEQENARQERARQLAGIASMIQKDYGATREQSVDFVKTMSNPDSLSLENLWKLYSMQTGISASGKYRQPSDEFVHQKRVQGIPPSISSMPGSQKRETRTKEDVIVDDMVADYNRSNPFG